MNAIKNNLADVMAEKWELYAKLFYDINLHEIEDDGFWDLEKEWDYDNDAMVVKFFHKGELKHEEKIWF